MVEVLVIMEDKKDLIDSLSQLDRIEYRQKQRVSMSYFFAGFLFYIIGLILFLNGYLMSPLIFFVLFVYIFYCSFKNEIKVKKEYFKVVKK